MFGHSVVRFLDREEREREEVRPHRLGVTQNTEGTSLTHTGTRVTPLTTVDAPSIGARATTPATPPRVDDTQPTRVVSSSAADTRVAPLVLEATEQTGLVTPRETHPFDQEAAELSSHDHDVPMAALARRTNEWNGIEKIENFFQRQAHLRSIDMQVHAFPETDRSNIIVGQKINTRYKKSLTLATYVQRRIRDMVAAEERDSIDEKRTKLLCHIYHNLNENIVCWREIEATDEIEDDSTFGYFLFPHRRKVILCIRIDFQNAIAQELRKALEYYRANRTRNRLRMRNEGST